MPMIKISEFLMKLEGDLALEFKDQPKELKDEPTPIREKATKERLKREITDLKFMT